MSNLPLRARLIQIAQIALLDLGWVDADLVADPDYSPMVVGWWLFTAQRRIVEAEHVDPVILTSVEAKAFVQEVQEALPATGNIPTPYYHGFLDGKAESGMYTQDIYLAGFVSGGAQSQLHGMKANCVLHPRRA